MNQKISNFIYFLITPLEFKYTEFILQKNKKIDWGSNRSRKHTFSVKAFGVGELHGDAAARRSIAHRYSVGRNNPSFHTLIFLWGGKCCHQPVTIWNRFRRTPNQPPPPPAALPVPGSPGGAHPTLNMPSGSPVGGGGRLVSPSASSAACRRMAASRPLKGSATGGGRR